MILRITFECRDLCTTQSIIGVNLCPWVQSHLEVIVLFFFLQKSQRRTLPTNFYVILYNYKAREKDDLDLRLVSF